MTDNNPEELIDNENANDDELATQAPIEEKEEEDPENEAK
jgi:DNA topoisomerase III